MVIGPAHGILLFWGTLEGWDVVKGYNVVDGSEITFRRCRIRGDRGELVTRYVEKNVYPYDKAMAITHASHPAGKPVDGSVYPDN
jgi:hypothetical protein